MERIVRPYISSEEYEPFISIEPISSEIKPLYDPSFSVIEFKNQLNIVHDWSDVNKVLPDPSRLIPKNSLEDYAFTQINQRHINKSYELHKENVSQGIGALTLKSLLSANTAPKNFMSSWSKGFLDLDAITPSELPRTALPILSFMEQVEPHIVIGCDRGGRLFGLALHAAWQQTRKGRPFPTLDGKLHFARVSKTEDEAVLQEKIDAIVAMSKQFGKQRGNEIAEGEQLRVLFIDDWTTGGGTMLLAQRLMAKYAAKTYCGVMCGPGADVTGDAQRRTGVSWHDRPEEIGVNYLSSLFVNTDDSVTQRQGAVAVRTPEAKRNREQIFEAAKQLGYTRSSTVAA